MISDVFAEMSDMLRLRYLIEGSEGTKWSDNERYQPIYGQALEKHNRETI